MTDNTFGSVKVMIVDNEAFSRKYLTRILEAIGIGAVETASSGADALAKLAEADADIDLVICDIEMPEMNGYEFVRRIRYGTVPRCRDVLILVLTGHPTEKNLQRAHTHKIDGFVTKPATVDLLKVQIRDLLATAGETGEAGHA